jgi:hypothetical protein
MQRYDLHQLSLLRTPANRGNGDYQLKIAYALERIQSTAVDFSDNVIKFLEIEKYFDLCGQSFKAFKDNMLNFHLKGEEAQDNKTMIAETVQSFGIFNSDPPALPQPTFNTVCLKTIYFLAGAIGFKTLPT